MSPSIRRCGGAAAESQRTDGTPRNTYNPLSQNQAQNASIQLQATNVIAHWLKSLGCQHLRVRHVRFQSGTRSTYAHIHPLRLI